VQRAISLVSELRQRLTASGRRRISDADHRFRVAARALDAVSPLATLDRGYAIVTDAESGKALTRICEVKKGDDIRARLAHGELLARITGVFDAED
jgi:exodeoxyribonuclease VII large subunit